MDLADTLQIEISHIGQWGLLLLAETPDGDRLSAPVQSILGRSLLIEGLKRLGQPHEQVCYRYGANGKPYLAGSDDCFFNISHCAGAVVCIIARAEVGIDVEIVSSSNMELAAHTMNSEQQQQINLSPWPEREFTTLWTLKESLLKCSGKGIDDNLKELLPSAKYRFLTIDKPQCNYIISICRQTDSLVKY